MSNRTPQQLAAQALRYGLKEFWPDQQHWAKWAFYMPIVASGKVVTGDRARCVQQMISDSARRVIGMPEFHPFPAETPHLDLWRQVRGIASQAIVAAATGDRPAERGESDECRLLCLNDHPDRTYEEMKAYVETAVRNLESVG